MERLYSITIRPFEEDTLKEAFETYANDILDYDGSKTFDIQGIYLKHYIVVCNEDTFNKIVSFMGGIRIF